MKSKVALVGLLFAAGLLPAQPLPTAKSVEPKTPTTKTPAATTTATTTPTTKTPAGKTPVTKVVKPTVEALPKIPGVEIARANGTFLGLEVAGGNFKLTFYDKKKKPMAIDVTRATARWPNTRSATIAYNFTVLNGSGTALVGQKPVMPPLAFNVYITLLKGDGDDAKAVEGFSVQMH